MKKTILIIVAISFFIIAVTSTVAMACCYVNKKVHNNTGKNAYDITIILEGQRTVKAQSATYFQTFNTWTTPTTTTLRWTNPKLPSCQTYIPPCTYVQVCYRLDKPARTLIAYWSDQNGNFIGRIKEPGKDVVYLDYPDRSVTLRFFNTLIDLPDPCVPDPCNTYDPAPQIPIRNITYAILNEELDLATLNDAGLYQQGIVLEPVPGSPGNMDPCYIDPNSSFILDLGEELEPGQVVVYRYEIGEPYDPCGIELIEWSQHEMKMPCPLIYGDTNLDCRVDLYDFALLAGHWLEENEPNKPGG
jgi:hypothetical protein